MLEYFESYYVGDLKPNTKTARVDPPFPIDRWNVLQRVLDGRCRSDAAPESWHNVFNFGLHRHPTVTKLNHILTEQKQTEIKMKRIMAFDEKKKDKKQADLDDRIHALVSTYEKYEILEFLDLIEATLSKHRKDVFVAVNAHVDEIIDEVASLIKSFFLLINLLTLFSLCHLSIKYK